VNSSVGVVVIGRNEGERLRRCLDSLHVDQHPTVYVDSGSSDGSTDLARCLGVDVVTLDLSTPFTAARARNEGLTRLATQNPELEFVQFVDGDCTVDPNWLDTARTTLKARSEVVVVCGRRREQHPRATRYNQLCDLEWDTPTGEALACGGDAMMRIRSVQAVGSYNASLLAGEEPELCVRLRQAGGKIERLPVEMTSHDAAMTRFGQWWKRNVRAGYAFAEVSQLHHKNPFGIWKKETRRNWIWGLIIPLMSLIMAPFTWGLSFLLLLVYPLQVLRIARRRRREGLSPAIARLDAIYCTLSKFPQVQGQLRFWFNRLRGRTGQIIEYKGPAATG
jgi:GT2 family glycosyltransferase